MTKLSTPAWAKNCPPPKKKTNSPCSSATNPEHVGCGEHPCVQRSCLLVALFEVKRRQLLAHAQMVPLHPRRHVLLKRGRGTKRKRTRTRKSSSAAIVVFRSVQAS